MHSNKVFLGWDRPLLGAAADWLIGRYGDDLGEVLVVIPARRAGRRLEELLAEKLSGRAWAPPEMVTVGEFPERLYALREGVEVATELQSQLARMASLRAADSKLLEAVMGRVPADEDVAGWWGLADTLGRLSEELAGAGIPVAEVEKRALETGFDLGMVGEKRWPVLTRLDVDYRATLATSGWVDRTEARRQASAGTTEPGTTQPVILVGVVDPPAATAELLRRRGNYTALIPAAEEHADGFEDVGGLVVGYWHDQDVPVKDLRVVREPEAQADAVVGILAHLENRFGSADSFTVGMGDATGAGLLRERIEAAGVPARIAEGFDAARSGPALLLEVMGRFARAQSMATLAEWARHPDARLTGGDAASLTKLDRYRNAHLVGRLPDVLPGENAEEERDRERWLGVKTLVDRALAFIPDDAERRLPWPTRATQLLEVLRRVYGSRDLDRVANHRLIEALSAVAASLDEVVDLDAAPTPVTAVPEVTFTQAIDLTLTRLRGTGLPEPGGFAAVELTGFLELALDDAPCAILTDVNEGILPEGGGADAFLPDALRTALGLPDARRRFARDVFLMNVVAHSREHVVTFACQQAATGEPRLPSRLLLADANDEVKVARVRGFYAEQDGECVEHDELKADDQNRTSASLGVAAEDGGRVELVLPHPVKGKRRPLKQGEEKPYSATELADYLRCPYRYYLKRVERAEGLTDREDEMDGAYFGNVLHGVLHQFGLSEMRDATDAEVISKWLNQELDRYARMCLGAEWSPAVRVQVAQMRLRLERFAREQAVERGKGWKIQKNKLEQEFKASFDPGGGEVCWLFAKIDRVDQHTDGHLRIVDYKSSDNGLTPEKKHHTSPKKPKTFRWKELQLPLYHYVGRKEFEQNAIEVAYWNLPADDKKSGPQVAKWNRDMLGKAEAEIGEVITNIRAGVFWPPEKPVSFDADLARLCADGAADRESLVKLATAQGDSE